MSSKQLKRSTKDVQFTKVDYQKNVKELGKKIEKIDNEIAELQKSEFNNSQIQRSAVQNYEILTQSLNEPMLTLQKQPKSKKSDSSKKIKVDLSKSELLNSIKQGDLKSTSEIQKEIYELENRQQRFDSKIEADVSAANNLHTQMIKVDQKHTTEYPMEVYRLRRTIEEAEINKKLDQSLIKSKQSCGASIEVLNVEDLFEGDVDVAYKNQ